MIPPVTGGAGDPATLIQSGHFEAEKLVNLAKHDYALEPNCQFTPDGKWIAFRPNMLGPTHVFQVEVAKAGQSRPDQGRTDASERQEDWGTGR